MAFAGRIGRAKLSTTVDSANFRFLEMLVSSGEAASVADAVDRAVRLLRKAESRAKLERDTANYFNGLPAEAGREEAGLAESLRRAGSGIDYDVEA